MTARTQALGRYGENAAARALAAAGLTVLDRNWRCRERVMRSVKLFQ